MSIEEWLKLAKKRVDVLDAELILLFGLKGVLPADVDRSYLFAHPEVVITQSDMEGLERLLKRREQGEPLSYILGYKEFYGRDFRVDERVLIPRPETEDLVDLALEVFDKKKKWRMLEIGTGSGCIATTLALETKVMGVEVEVWATDVSLGALEVAQENARRLEAKVQFLESDLLEKVKKVADFDVLVANLPYVDPEWEWITRKSLDFEPQGALYAAEKGLALYDRFLDQIVQFGAPKYLIFEADPCQHEDLVRKTVEKGYVLDKILGFGLRFKRK